MSFVRGVRTALGVALSGLLLLAIDSAHAQVPRDEAAFTREMADRLAAAIPEAHIVVKGPLTLGVNVSGDQVGFQVNVDRVWTFCTHDAERCSTAMADYAAKTAATIKQVSAPIDASTLRVVLRPAAYISAYKQQAAGRPGADPIAAPLAADIWWLVVIDMPQAARVLTAHDLDSLKMAARPIMERGRSNTQAVLRPLSSVIRPLPANGVGIIEGDYYESSRLLWHEAWADLAASLKGRLLVAAPDPRIIVYADGGVPKARQTLTRRAKAIAKKSERPLSTTILEWSPEGWKKVGR